MIFWDNFVYYYSISFKGEGKSAYASGFALGTRVNEKLISPSLLNLPMMKTRLWHPIVKNGSAFTPQNVTTAARATLVALAANAGSSSNEFRIALTT